MGSLRVIQVSCQSFYTSTKVWVCTTYSIVATFQNCKVLKTQAEEENSSEIFLSLLFLYRLTLVAPCLCFLCL